MVSSTKGQTYFAQRKRRKILYGGIKKGSTPLMTTKEELKEEVGHGSQSIKRIGKFSSISGVASEICFVYLATDLVFVGQELEESELEAGLKVVEIGIKKSL